MFKYTEPCYERIRRIRMLREKYLKDNDCSETRISKRLGIRLTELRKIESGRQEVDSIMLNKLSVMLGVSIEHLASEKVMMEDLFVEPIIYRSQIGSIIHARRTQLASKRQHDKKKYNLKSAAKKLGIASMELKRIEELGNSKYLRNHNFLFKVSNLFNLPLSYIKDIAVSSFPRGKDKKEVTVRNTSQIQYIKEGNKIRGLLVLRGNMNKAKLDMLKKRIELEISLLE